MPGDEIIGGGGSRPGGITAEETVTPGGAIPGGATPGGAMPGGGGTPAAAAALMA